MLNILAIADALKARLAAINGVKEVLLGVNTYFPATPAVEIIIRDFGLKTIGASLGTDQHQIRFDIGVYVPVTGQLESAEQELLPVVVAIVDNINSYNTNHDRTLGGLVEDIRVRGGKFDLVTVEQQLYRAAFLDFLAGELD